MKKYSLLLLFYLPTAVISGQNWQTVLSNRSTYFYNSCSTSVLALKIDSSGLTGTDSILYHYRGALIGCYYTPYCFHQTDTLWAGANILLKPNGDNVFFNHANDSIIIKTTASLNDTWSVFEFGNGDYISGEIDAVNYVPVVGNMDSVKSIRLTARNSSGTTISHAINGHYIKISKSYGLVSTVHLFNFPTEEYEYSIVGMNNPASGLQNLSAGEVFNLDTGDLFQYSNYEDYGIINYSQDYKELRLLNKSVSANMDTLTFTFDSLFYHYYKYGNWDTSYFVHDTEVVSVIISDYATLNELPHQVHLLDTTVWPTAGFTESILDSSLYNLRRIKKLSDFFVLEPQGSCFTYPVGHCIFPVDGYAEGLGFVSRYDWDGGFSPCRDYHLVYFKKGNETWGVPLDWPTILKIDNPANFNIDVSPNPFSSLISIRNLHPLKTSITLSDETGRIIIDQTSIPAGDLKIPASDISNGIYFLTVQNETGAWHSKLIKQ